MKTDKTIIVMGTRITQFDNAHGLEVIDIPKCSSCGEFIVMTGYTGKQKILSETKGMEVITMCMNCVLADEELFELMLSDGYITDEQAAEVNKVTGDNLTKEEIMEEVRNMSKDKEFMKMIKLKFPKEIS